MNITECLTQITEVTKDNLAILRALNDSLHTNKNHISVNVDGKIYAIPSFISLENKINALEDNLNNVLNAPKTGEAFTYFDGTTQKLELGGYATTPPHVELNGQNKEHFKYRPNNIFKDFMNPNPYIELDIKSIPNNINHVSVKKIVAKNSSLVDLLRKLCDFDNKTISADIKYSDAYKILSGFKLGEDYDEYDTIKRLPLRDSSAYGIYNISRVIREWQDSNFEEHYELELDSDPVYHINNNTIQRDIIIGDKLVTINDKVIMTVEDVNPTTRFIKVKIEYGGYANLIAKPNTGDEPIENNMYSLKFYNPVDHDRFKYIDVPLEEDQNVIIFISAINNTTNIQSPWGVGLYFNTYNLKVTNPEDPSKEITFKEYYDKYVNNVGDSLNAITHMMDDDSQIEKLTKDEFTTLKQYKPMIGGKLLTVTQINKHLNDAKSVKAIRNLYEQKKQYKVELENNQKEIDEINMNLSKISFDDTTNTRSVFENRLVECNAKKKELTSSLAAVITDINSNINDSDVPVERAKYHIRGFVDVRDIDNDDKYKAKVIKIDVEYRYKNRNKFTGSAETIGDESYIYSDWNRMSSEYRKLIPINNGVSYKYKLEDLNEKMNELSFNQIDIPISQGESVDIRIRYVYNLGYPFVEMVSDWSPIYNQEFPKEFLQNVEVIDIINENNEDFKKQQFTSILDKTGVVDHTNDSFQDQTIKYFHKPEHIASGFYTPERRVIPLLDKLKDIDGDLTKLMAEVYGAINNELEVMISDNSTSALLRPYVVNTFKTLPYNTNVDNTGIINEDVKPGRKFAYSQLTIALRNKGKYPIKLYSMFPGDYNQVLTEDTAISKYDVNDYITDTGGVYMQCENPDPNTTLEDDKVIRQRLNQFIYFRTRINGANPIYGDSKNEARDVVSDDKIQDYVKVSGNPNRPDKDIVFEHRHTPLDDDPQGAALRSAFLFPYPGTIDKICIDSKDEYITIDPGDSIILPLSFYYWINSSDLNKPTARFSVTRTISFDLRTSLFSDPRTYKLNVLANNIDTQNSKILTATKLDRLPAYNMTTNTNTLNGVLATAQETADIKDTNKF